MKLKLVTVKVKCLAMKNKVKHKNFVKKKILLRGHIMLYSGKVDLLGVLSHARAERAAKVTSNVAYNIQYQHIVLK